MPRWDLSLTEAEVDAYLAVQRTIRLATCGEGGRPHVVPLWFVWLDRTVFMNSTRGNRTVRNLERNPVATGAVDDGGSYGELRGVVLSGPVERADGDPRVEEVRARWSAKYLGGRPVPYERWRNRQWLRMRPDRVVSWDFRKIPDRRAREAGGPPPAPGARIALTGIPARGRHGASPGEQDRPQDFVVDLEVVVEVGRDELAAPLDYRDIARVAREAVEGPPVVLLETLAGRVAEAVRDLGPVREVRATVHKPRAAGSVGARDVSATAVLGS